MVEVFGIKDRCAEALGRGEKRCVVIFEPVAARQGEACRDVSLVDGDKRQCSEECQPSVDDCIVCNRFSSGNIGEFCEGLSRNPKERPEDEVLRNIMAARITIPLRSRVEQDVRVEKAFDLLGRHRYRPGSI